MNKSKIFDLIKINKLEIKKNKKNLQAIANLSNLFLQLNKFKTSIFYLDELLKLDLKFYIAHYNKGNILLYLNKYKDAIECYENTLNINPQHINSYCNHGVALTKLKKFKEAIISFDKALKLNSQHVDSYCNKGTVLIFLNKFEEAIMCLDKAIELDPQHVDSYCNRGVAFNNLDNIDEAIKNFKKAIDLNPYHVGSYSNLGSALTRLNKLNESLTILNNAIKIDPTHVGSYCNRGNVYSRLFKFKEANRDYDKCIEIDKNYADAHWNKSIVNLLTKNYQKGFSLYEWRWKTKSLDSPALRNFSEKIWLGNFSIKNKKIFIHAEQGLGDTIQFCRYLELIKNEGAYVILEYPKPLKKLLSSLSCVDEFVENGNELNNFDCHCPLLSLPLAFKTNLETIPKKIPYLYVNNERINKWKNFLGNQDFKIGISWQSKGNFNSIEKSFPLIFFKNISKIPNIRLVSLQKNFGIEQLSSLPSDCKIQTLPADFDDGDNAFLDSAAILKCVDLFITCDSALGHLAGSLGTKTWLLLKHYPDWRWHLDDDFSPWYPNHRIFRQSIPGDWKGVFEQVEFFLKRVLAK